MIKGIYKGQPAIVPTHGIGIVREWKDEFPFRTITVETEVDGITREYDASNVDLIDLPRRSALQEPKQ